MQIGTALRARWLRDKSKYEEKPIVPTHHEHNHEHTIGKILVLKEDFYAIAFVSHTKNAQIEFNISKHMLGRNFYACLWIFLIEMSLIALIFKSVVIDAVDFKIYTPNVQVYICRFIATVLLHMELIEDVKQGLNMIHFLNTHPEKFSNIGIPFCIGMM